MANSSRLELKHLVLIGAYSLALGAHSVLCNHDYSNKSPPIQNATPTHAANGFTPTRSEQVAHYQQYSPASPQRELLTRKSNVDFTGLNPIMSSSSTNTGLMAPNSKPSVYHSIIDRSEVPKHHQASPAIQTSASTIDDDLNTAAGHHHGHAYGKYYEYRAVPKKKTWKYGYKRGNHKHTISRHEHGKAGKHPHFKTKVKWHDKKSKGKGIHLWDYNHHDKKHYHHHG